MIIYLTPEQVVNMHEKLINKFGGLKGIKSMHALLHAIEAPKSFMFGREQYPTIYDKAAAYVYFIVQSHPFHDGNKRTGFTCALVFLKANKISINFNAKAFEDFVVEIATNNKNIQEIAKFLEKGK